MNENRAVAGTSWLGALLIVGLLSIPAGAQDAQRQWVSVKSGPVAVMLDPKPASVVVGLVTPGIPLEVREIRGEWYWVVLPKDEGEPAARSGWIPAAMVVHVPAPAPSAPPTPTAERPPVRGSAAPPASAPKRSPQRPTPPALPAAESTAAEPTGAPRTDRFFIAVNGARHESSLAFQDSRSDPFYAETRSWTAGYAAKGGTGFDGGAAVRLWRELAAAVSVSRFQSQRRTAAIEGEIPHPFWFERPRPIGGESQGLAHSERTIHVSAQWTLPPVAGLRLSVFGGPSFFTITRDLVEDVEFSEAYPYNTASYERASIQRVSQTERGFHAGIDASWFLTRQIGFGAVVRYAHAEVPLESPATGRDVPVDAGGVQVGAGLRVRLGGWR